MAFRGFQTLNITNPSFTRILISTLNFVTHTSLSMSGRNTTKHTRFFLISNTKNTDMSILQQSDSKFTSVLLFGDTSFDNNKNSFILDAAIDYIISTRRFDEPLFNSS